MALPLKDIPQFGVQQHTHRAFARIAKNRGMTLSALGREIVEKFVATEIHNAKVVLGMDDDNAEQTEFDLGAGESDRIPPKGGKR